MAILGIHVSFRGCKFSKSIICLHPPGAKLFVAVGDHLLEARRGKAGETIHPVDKSHCCFFGVGIRP